MKVSAKTENEISRCTEQDTDCDVFVFSSQDDKGHSSYLRVPISKDVAMIIAEIIQKGYFPYRTREDLVRDAIYHRLYYLLQKLDLNLGSKLQRERDRQAIVEKYEIEKEHINWLSKMESMLEDITDEKVRGEMVALAYEQIVSEPDPYWRGKGLQILKDKYARYVPTFSLDNRV